MAVTLNRNQDQIDAIMMRAGIIMEDFAEIVLGIRPLTREISDQFLLHHKLAYPAEPTDAKSELLWYDDVIVWAGSFW